MNRRPSPDLDPAAWAVTLERPNGHVRVLGGAPDDQEARNLADDERIDRVRRAYVDRNRPWTRDNDGVWWAELTDGRVLVCYPPATEQEGTQ